MERFDTLLRAKPPPSIFANKLDRVDRHLMKFWCTQRREIFLNKKFYFDLHLFHTLILSLYISAINAKFSISLSFSRSAFAKLWSCPNNSRASLTCEGIGTKSEGRDAGRNSVIFLGRFFVNKMRTPFPKK